MVRTGCFLPRASDLGATVGLSFPASVAVAGVATAKRPQNSAAVIEREALELDIQDRNIILGLANFDLLRFQRYRTTSVQFH
jgi:hypothetical protein